MKVSVIAAVYQDVRALELIIGSLRSQTYTNFELVVAEDGSDCRMREYISSVTDIDIKHTTQGDVGIRKSRSQNNGIIASSGDYLIFIDGDCIPYSSFIEGHVRLSERNTILTGRRVNLGTGISSALRDGTMKAANLENRFIFNIPKMFADKTTHIEQGIKLHPDGLLYKKIVSTQNRNLNILGCNFSCFKEAIVSINGFDESYEGTALADDTDIQWRFEASGAKLKSCNNIANIFHLYHTREHRDVDHTNMRTLMNMRTVENRYVCDNGLSAHNETRHEG